MKATMAIEKMVIILALFCISNIRARLVFYRKNGRANPMDLTHFWRNRNRRLGGQPSRFDWIGNGAVLIGGTGSLP